MTDEPIFRKVDCLALRVPDLNVAIDFYANLGHEVLWRTSTSSGLRLPDSEAELVLQTERPSPETDLTVTDVRVAVGRFVAAGGSVVVEPFEIAIGLCAVVADPWDNHLVILDNSKGRLVTDAAGNVTGVDQAPAGITHRYEASCFWEGSTGLGYERYNRTHTARTVPPTADVMLSADPAFRGDPTILNPEQLVVLAVASCQLLSFLAVAARARLNVVAYEDHAEGLMPEDDAPVRLTRIELRPAITVEADVPEDRVRRLVELAHRECYIANSLRTRVTVTPTVNRVALRP